MQIEDIIDDLLESAMEGTCRPLKVCNLRRSYDTSS